MQVNAVSKRPCREIRSTADSAEDRKCGAREHEMRARGARNYSRRMHVVVVVVHPVSSARARNRAAAAATPQKIPRYRSALSERESERELDEGTKGRGERGDARTNARVFARICRVALIKLNCAAFPTTLAVLTIPPLARPPKGVHASLLSRKYSRALNTLAPSILSLMHRRVVIRCSLYRQRVIVR